MLWLISVFLSLIWLCMMCCCRVQSCPLLLQFYIRYVFVTVLESGSVCFTPFVQQQEVQTHAEFKLQLLDVCYSLSVFYCIKRVKWTYWRISSWDLFNLFPLITDWSLTPLLTPWYSLSTCMRTVFCFFTSTSLQHIMSASFFDLIGQFNVTLKNYSGWIG